MSNNNKRKNSLNQECVIMVNVKMVWINALIKLVNNKETLAINQAKCNVIIVIIIVTITIILMIKFTTMVCNITINRILVILHNKNKIKKTPKKYSILITINIILCNYSYHIMINNSWNMQQ